MTLSTEDKNRAARIFCSHFPNAHYGVVRVWVSAEGGANDNIFGVTIGGKLQKYPTMEAGVLAAVTRIKTLLVYRNLRAALESPHTLPKGCPGYGKHALSQANAIVRSVWNTGKPWSPYYARIFTDYGYRVTPA